MKNYNCILLVDDDPICNFINREILRKNKVCKKICIARNGKEALTFLNEYKLKNHCLPDILLVDINMPVMDGFEFLQEFEKLAFLGKEKTRVIILSNTFSKSDIEVLRKMGHLYYLNKPLNKNKLRDLLNIRTA
ncbi:MAG TPA: response regulator [Cytophagaceae bacterium]|jgi:CheY-like chemotaxis protein|nr:response regulator [Cytophagaceae bacterium]